MAPSHKMNIRANNSLGTKTIRKVVFATLLFVFAAAAQSVNNTGSMPIRNVTVGAVNCNSLNLSATNKQSQISKIYAIAKMKRDIIFLSDIRLSKKKESDIADIHTNFLTNPYNAYTFLYNSTQNKRGTGILISTGACFSEILRIADPQENFLIVLLEDSEGKRMICASIYGPNNYDPDFFANLEQNIRACGNYPVIIGGDWNTITASEPVAQNIECHNMAGLPNSRHIQLVQTLAANLTLVDPFRFLWPNKTDFSYSTKIRNRNNRSRIDFFLVSDTFLAHVENCYIDQHRLTNAFDHRAIHFELKQNKKRKNRAPLINNRILSDPDISIVVRTAVIETYVHHGDRDMVLQAVAHNPPEPYIGRVWALLREAGPDPVHLPDEEVSNELIENRGRNITEIENILAGFNIEHLQYVDLLCPETVFYETLLNNIRNEVTSYQSAIFGKKNRHNTTTRTTTGGQETKFYRKHGAGHCH